MTITELVTAQRKSAKLDQDKLSQVDPDILCREYVKRDYNPIKDEGFMQHDFTGAPPDMSWNFN